jgi:hypothetical protein
LTELDCSTACSPPTKAANGRSNKLATEKTGSSKPCATRSRRERGSRAAGGTGDARQPLTSAPDQTRPLRQCPSDARITLPSRRPRLICAGRKSAMCGRLRVGKSFLHVCSMVGAAMCSAFRCGSHDRKMALKIHCFSALARALSPADPHSSRPGKLKEAFRGHGWGRAKQGSVG